MDADKIDFNQLADDHATIVVRFREMSTRPTNFNAEAPVMYCDIFVADGRDAGKTDWNTLIYKAGILKLVNSRKTSPVPGETFIWSLGWTEPWTAKDGRVVNAQVKAVTASETNLNMARESWTSHSVTWPAFP